LVQSLQDLGASFYLNKDVLATERVEHALGLSFSKVELRLSDLRPGTGSFVRRSETSEDPFSRWRI
jgi:hypothetical protein